MPSDSTTPDAIGQPVDEMDQFWLETARTAVKESVSSWRRRPSSSSER